MVTWHPAPGPYSWIGEFIYATVKILVLGTKHLSGSVNTRETVMS
jgi:hypothetical protein